MKTNTDPPKINFYIDINLSYRKTNTGPPPKKKMNSDKLELHEDTHWPPK